MGKKDNQKAVKWAKVDKTGEYRCRKCGAVVGELREVDDVQLLYVGGALARSVHAVCAQCGAEVHFSVSDALLNRIVQQRAERAKQTTKTILSAAYRCPRCGKEVERMGLCKDCLPF